MWSFRQLDEALVLFINHPAGQSALFDKLAFDVSDSPLLKGGVFLAFYWWLWFARESTGRRDVVVALVAAVVVAFVSRLLQVGLPFHQRPLHTPTLGVHLPLSVDPEALNTFSSFPSDHAMLFFALCVPIWTRSRALGAAAALWTLVVICLPRIYLGYHYPSDVIAGGVMGVALMMALRSLIGRTLLPDRVVRFATARPAVFYAIAFPISLELAVLFYDLRHFALDAVQLGKTLLV